MNETTRPMIDNGSLTSKLRFLWDALRPSGHDAKIVPVVGDDRETFLLGTELRNSLEVAQERQELLNDLFAGEPAATLLVGLLMVFRASPGEKLPMLLKDIGEAYYRWQPLKADRPSRLEAFLVDWLSRSCQNAGIPSRISLVRPGERFDSARHYASMPGVEVIRVSGWIVLREDGKVYSKARVTAK